MWETWVRSLGWEDPLEKGKATYSSILAWRIPWTIQVHGVAKSWTRLSYFLIYYYYYLKCIVTTPQNPFLVLKASYIMQKAGWDEA